ncbi:CPBP family intramembrane glutamic endopeptidase [Brevibacterium senegalense]|uniref:CPBP family intramembrane glutamic endopeptidase n=1 Tax=Brevibacterium senegalense TaxID=1033736 RepID=UPI0003721A34|nr:CPBP family intramembrane glutamic endopeptidase [Brevibacterium senegalense]
MAERPAVPPHDPPAPRLRHAALAGGLVVVCGAVTIGLVLLAHKLFGWRPDTGALILIVLGTLTLASAAAVGLVVRRTPELTPQVLGFRRPTLRTLHLLWQIPVTFIVAVAVSGLVLTTLFDGSGTGDGSSTAQDIGAMGGGLLPILVLWLLAAVLTPLWEEVLFRGLIFQALAHRMPWFLAALLAAAIFAAIHIAPPALAYVFVLGLSACLLLRFHGNLWAPIILHAVNNTIVVLVGAAAVL